MSMFPGAWLNQPHTVAVDLPRMLHQRLSSRSLVDRGDGTGGIGLGWLITIAVLGGILLFACVGYLLAWKIRQRRSPVTKRVYATDPASDHYDPTALTTVLSRRRLLVNSQTTMQVLPSDASEMTLGNGRGDQLPWHPPPVLPPLPTARSFGLSGFKNRWSVDGESDHGPERRRWSWRNSWVGVMMGSGALATATLPDVEAHAPNPAPAQAPAELKDMSPERNEIQVQKKRQSRPPAATLGASATAPILGGGGEEERGRSRVAAQMRYIKPDDTETDLKDILACTEQRLRDGTSRSPVKTPRGSPSKASPMKTPRTGSSTRTRGYMTPSPSKKKDATPGSNKTRGPSVSSVGSAADSLIRHATEELQLPGGMGSPSRLRGQEWAQQPQPQEQSTSPQRSPPKPSPRRRSRSLDSDVSSALSTLYSVGEPEDEVQNAASDDPFVESRPVASPAQETGQQLTGPRPLQRAKTLKEGKANGEVVDESAVPAPLRTISVNSHLGRVGRRGSLKMAPVLSPPTKRGSVETKPKSNFFVNGQRSVSEGSESVYTDVTVPESDADDGEVTPKGLKTQDSISNVATPTRTRQGTADLTSSPLNEREVLSKLYDSAQPRRGLPKPPTRIMLNDETIIPTPLSPRPKSQHQRPPTRRASIASISSSNYDQDFNEDSDVATNLPGRRATTSGLHSVGSTIAELRRMNSVVSSYSVASIASTVFGEGNDENESPTLPALRGGGFSPDRTQSKNSKDGKKNYLNVGAQSSLRVKDKGKSRNGHSRSNSRSGTPKAKRDENKKQGVVEEEEKENQSLAPRVRFELPSPRRSPNGPRKPTRSPTRLPVRDEREMERKRKNRESAESLGLYDQDGFLKSSPDREAIAKGGRLRM